MKKIFIIAGEQSGDIHGARLMKSLKSLDSDIKFIGIGGNAMIAEGLDSLVSLKDVSVVGFLEVAKKYRFFKKLLDKCKSLLSDSSINAFVPIDYPGFNIRLAGYAKSIGLPVIYYIAPQLWAWGKNRARNLTGCVDKLLCVFPFEQEYFSKFGIDTHFVGHPLMDDPVFDFQDDLSHRRKLITMLAGSRRQEAAKHLSLLIKTAELINRKLPDYKFAVAASESVGVDFYSDMLKGLNEWEIWDNSRELMKQSAAGLVKTGTSTLEATLCRLPFVMYYKTSAITYLMGKRLVNLPYIALPNILLDKAAVKEYIQQDATPELLAAEIVSLVENNLRRSELLSDYEKVRALLGNPGASGNAAQIIMNELDKR